MQDLRLLVGRIAELTLPFVVRDMAAGRNPDKLQRLKRAIRDAQITRGKTQGDPRRIEAALQAFWQSAEGSRFHESHIEGRFSHFMENHSDIIDRFNTIAQEKGLRCSRLVEIGSGDGNVLNHCLDRVPGVTSFVGIELNADAVTTAQRSHGSDGKLQFIHGDARPWLADHPHPGTVVLTNGGVLEYFAPENLDALFADLARHAPAAVMLIEPRAPGHDYQTDSGSPVFGRENTFSHNYPARLKSAGFQVDECRLMKTSLAEWALVIAHI